MHAVALDAFFPAIPCELGEVRLAWQVAELCCWWHLSSRSVCVGRQGVSSWGGGGMHHLLFKQQHLFGMLSILSVRAWTGSIQERLDIVINASGGRLLHLPACPERKNLLNLLGAIAVRTRATVPGSTAATSAWSSCCRAMLWGRGRGLDFGHWVPFGVRASTFAS